MSPVAPPRLEALSNADLEALRLSSQVLAHKAALAGMPRVALFFSSVESEAVVESAARGQPGERGDQLVDHWRTAPFTPVDRAAIAAYLELLSGNERLSPTVRDYAAQLLRARSAIG